MRIFKNFEQAVNEIQRDLAEMGIDVHPETMQDKNVAHDVMYGTKEIQNYIYTVTDAGERYMSDLRPVQPWANHEFAERINWANAPVNPGTAYLTRDDVWNEFLHDGKFAYTYNERLWKQIQYIAQEIILHPSSRQLFMSIWNPDIDIFGLGGGSRVPCSLGYLFQYRDGKLNMTYFMRSCDFATHFQNDIYLAMRMLSHMAFLTNKPVGNFTQYMASLHVYNKDIEGIF